MPTDYTSTASALTGRQARLYGHRVSLWRRSVTVGVGVPSAAFAQVGTNAPCRIFPSPSQFMLQQIVQSEGDNVYTLDIIDFPTGVDVAPGDVLKVTTGPASLLNGYWVIRGDQQPFTYRANVLRFIAARESGDLPPAGVS